MNWKEVQQQFPHQWLVVRSLQSTKIENIRTLEKMEVLSFHETFQEACKEARTKEERLFVLHTDMEIPKIREEWNPLMVAKLNPLNKRKDV